MPLELTFSSLSLIFFVLYKIISRCVIVITEFKPGIFLDFGLVEPASHPDLPKREYAN